VQVQSDIAERSSETLDIDCVVVSPVLSKQFTIDARIVPEETQSSSAIPINESIRVVGGGISWL
jgi:hypothetical protein